MYKIHPNSSNKLHTYCKLIRIYGEHLNGFTCHNFGNTKDTVLPSNKPLNMPTNVFEIDLYCIRHNLFVFSLQYVFFNAY